MIIETPHYDDYNLLLLRESNFLSYVVGCCLTEFITLLYVMLVLIVDYIVYLKARKQFLFKIQCFVQVIIGGGGGGASFGGGAAAASAPSGGAAAAEAPAAEEKKEEKEESDEDMGFSLFD